MKTIDSKWVFRVLTDVEGNVKRRKARLCARGFLQKPGIDYTDTFAPVVRCDSLRILLATVATKDLELAQFDVQTAFLYGELEEQIYMEVPEGLDVKEEESKSAKKKSFVCKLSKALYGLKQAPRCWNKKFSEFLRQYSFKETDAEQCIFVGTFDDSVVYLALYVDDGLIAAKSKKVIKSVLTCLENAFKITVGVTKIFVGLQIERDRSNKSISLHQKAYIKKILERFRMVDAKPVSTPADPHTTLYPVSDDDVKSESVPYREAVGSLIFLAVVSRPDIMYAVNSVSKFLSNHNDTHWRAVKRIFAYLVGTCDLKIEYRSGGSNADLIGYSDADFAGDVETRRSTTGFVFSKANGPITWCAERQKIVTLSTTEAEYVAASTAARELIWIRRLLDNLGCPCAGATVLRVDNLNSINLAKNPEYHKRTKHIDTRYHFIREKVVSKEIKLEHVPTEIQKADMFTKPLPKNRFKMLCDQINIK